MAGNRKTTKDQHKQKFVRPRQRVEELERAKEKIKHRDEELGAFYKIALAINATLEIDELLNLVYEEVKQLIHFDSFSIALIDEERNELRFELTMEGGRPLPKRVRKLTPRGSLAGWVAHSKEPLLIKDWEKEQDSLPATTHIVGKPVRSWLGVPLLHRNKTIGVMTVQSFSPCAFAEKEEHLLTAFANQVAVAIENARLYEMERQRSAQLAAVSAVAKRIAAILNLDKLLQETVELITQTFGYYFAAIMLVDTETDELVFKVGVRAGGYPEKAPVNYRQKMMEGMIGWSAYLGETLLANDVSQEPRYIPGNLPETKSELDVPLKHRDKVIGVLDLESEELNAFSQHDVVAMETLAGQIAIAIENARLFEETERLRAFNESIVQGIAEAILIQDAEGIFTFANPAAEELTGYTRGELTGRHWTTLVPEEQIKKARTEAAKRPQGIKSRYEATLLRKDKARIPVIVSAQPLFQAGKFVGVLSAFTDITERKQAEEKIKLAYAELNRIFNTAANGMRVVDKDFNVLRVNKAFLTLAGISEDEAVGKKCYETFSGRLCHTPDCPVIRILGGEERVEYEEEKSAVMALVFLVL